MKRVGVNRKQLESRIGSLVPCAGGEGLGVGEPRVAGRGLDEHRGEAGQVRVEWVDDGIVHRVPSEVGRCAPACLVGSAQRHGGVGRGREAHREVDPGTEQERSAGERGLLLPQCQQ